MNVVHKLIAILFALAGVGMVVGEVKRAINRGSFNVIFLALGVMFLVFAVLAGRKSGGGSDRSSV